MPLKSAKHFLRRQRMKRLGVYEEIEIARLPLAYSHGAWMVHPEPVIADSIVYYFGVGSSIAWDLAMIDRFGVSIRAFDPTPRSIEWVNRQELPDRFVFHEYGVAGRDGTMTVYPPRRRTSFNYSSLDRGRSYSRDELIEVPVFRVPTIMNELGHDRIDVLKMDIEGGEYAVIDDIVNEKIPIGQILVEFHHNFRTVRLNRTLDAVRRLKERGYKIFHVSERSYELSFINGNGGVPGKDAGKPLTCKDAEHRTQHDEPHGTHR